MSSNHRESDLIAGAKAGDRHALRELLRQKGEAVRARIAPRIGRKWRSVLSADDVMQQSYAEAIHSIHRFEDLGDGSFAGWLTRIAVCNLQDAVKALETEKRGGDWQRVTSVPGQDSRVTLLRMLTCHGTSPEAAVSREEAGRLLDEAIARLPKVYQRVVREMDLASRPAAELADELGRSVGAVHMLRARAHDRLRLELGGSSGFFD